MEQNDFIYWLVGFTENKNTLSLVEMDIVKEKLEEVIDEGINRDYSLGYFPSPFSTFDNNSPYTYPGMQGIDKIKDMDLNIDQLMMDMDEYAKDVDVLNAIEDGLYMCDAYGGGQFLTWNEVKTFIDNRKRLSEEDN